MPDNIGDSISTTGRVTVGNSLTGEIETTNDSDAFAVELVAGRTYRIDLEGAATDKGTLADPFLRWLRDSSGNGLHGTRDYDGGEGLNPRQVFTPQVSGTYYITASGQGDSVGTYTLTVTDTSAPVFGASDYGFQLAENADGSTTRVSLGTVSATDPEGASVGYSIVGGNESGSFEIDAQTGELFYVGAGEDYEAGAAQFDMTIRASDGTLTADAAVSVAITDVPEQTIVVPADPEILQTVSELAGEDFSTNISTAGRIVVDDTATGNIGTRSDRDWFAVELVADREYQIDLRGSPTGDGTLSDPYLRGIHDAEGTLISGTTNDDGGAGYNSRVTFTASETGTYYIAAGAFGRLGTYELEVRDVSPQTAHLHGLAPPRPIGIVPEGGRLAAAKLLGLEEIPAIRLSDLTEAQVQAYVIADNRLAELAGWDEELLSIELKALCEIELDFDIEVIGFNTAEIDGLVLGPTEPDDDADRVPEIDADAPPIRVEIPSSSTLRSRMRSDIGRALVKLTGFTPRSL